MSAKPWHRQDGETEAAFAAFRGYLDLGPGRTVVEAYRRTRGEGQVSEGCRAPGHYQRWVDKWAWVERSKAYDQHQAEAADKARVDAVAAEAAKWERRREKARQANWRMAKGMASKVLAALEKKASLGQLTAKDVAALSATAAKLAALSVGEPTERVEQSGTVEHRGVQVTLTAADLEQLDAPSLVDVCQRLIRGGE